MNFGDRATRIKDSFRDDSKVQCHEKRSKIWIIRLFSLSLNTRIHHISQTPKLIEERKP